MKNRIICKVAALAICACLSAECLAYVNPMDVSAGEAEKIESVSENEGSEYGQEQNAETEEATDKEAAADVTGNGKVLSAQSAEDEKATVKKAEPKAEEDKISLSDENVIVTFVGAVNNNQYYYNNGKKITPRIKVFVGEKITGDEEDIPESEILEQNGIKFRVEEIKQEDYDVDEYPNSAKLGKYKITVYALDNAKTLLAGSKKEVEYEIIEKEHKWGDWKTTVKQTALKEGSKKRTCSICGKVETAKIAKTKATIKLNMTTITLKRKQSTTTFKVSGLATGDYVKSYKSSNKKIFTVDKKGKIKAKNKSGSAKLTVTLASGKTATAKVKVQKGTVKTTKLTVNTSSLVLLKGGTYTLKTTRAPLTTQQKVTYSSSNKKVATVSSKGVVTAKKKGTAKITVKSGSKKKTVKVTVQVQTFPKGDTNAFLNSCKKIAGIIESDGNWIYYSGSGMKKSFAEARDYVPRRTSCANFVNFCMQDFGTLEPGMAFYSDGNGKLVYQGSSSKKAATKKLVEKNYDIINIGGKKAIKAGLQPGDICLYKGHTNVFAGLNSEGVPTWYDGGRNATSDGKPESGYFTHMFRTSYLNSMPVYIVLRMKK